MTTSCRSLRAICAHDSPYGVAFCLERTTKENDKKNACECKKKIFSMPSHYFSVFVLISHIDLSFSIKTTSMVMIIHRHSRSTLNDKQSKKQNAKKSLHAQSICLAEDYHTCSSPGILIWNRSSFSRGGPSILFSWIIGNFDVTYCPIIMRI